MTYRNSLCGKLLRAISVVCILGASESTEYASPPAPRVNRPAYSTATAEHASTLDIRDFASTLQWAQERFEMLQEVSEKRNTLALEEATRRVTSEIEKLDVLGRRVTWSVPVTSVDEQFVHLQHEWHGFGSPITFFRLSLSSRGGELETDRHLPRNLATTLAPGAGVRIIGRLAVARVEAMPPGPAICVFLEDVESDVRTDEELFSQREPLQDAKSNNNVGVLLMARHELFQAERHFRRALLVNPDYSDAHYNLAQILTQSGQYDEAVKHYKACLNVQEWFVSHAHYNLGVILWNNQDIKGALEHLEIAVRLDPKNPTICAGLASCLEKTDPERAAKLHQNALQMQRDAPASRRIDPRYAEVYYESGRLLERIGRPDVAIPQYHKALEIAPGYEDARKRLQLLETQRQDPSSLPLP